MQQESPEVQIQNMHLQKCSVSEVIYEYLNKLRPKNKFSCFRMLEIQMQTGCVKIVMACIWIK